MDCPLSATVGAASSSRLPLRAAKAVKRRLKEVEELPEEVQEMVRRAYDIGLRINSELGVEERRESQAKRYARIKRSRRIQARAANRAPTRRSSTGCCGSADRQPRPMRGARPLRSITWSGRADAASSEAIRAVAVLMRGSA